MRANADTPREARQAREFGAEGIGLCRTEHMFFEESRILAMREMICADDEAGRRKALAKMLPMQRADFEGLFEIMAGLPVTIRLLDPPLHEFLPHEQKEAAAVAKELGVPLQKLENRVAELHEFNPMLGFRGCRLAIRYPEITEMQARAIFEGAVNAAKKTGKPVVPEVMIPLVAYRTEFDLLRDVIVATAQAVEKETGARLDYQIGTMIELPRAALRAAEIAAGEDGAQFFSFGTNDLTQTCLGLSRDDAAPILPDYTEKAIFEVDPFVSIDRDGVGELVRIGTRARAQGAARPQGRHLRRARRRPGLDRLLPRDGARLRVLLAVPRAGRAPRRRAGRHQARRGDPGSGTATAADEVQAALLLDLVDARAPQARPLVARDHQQDEQHGREEEAPRRPERVVAPLHAGDDGGQDRRDDRNDAPDGNDPDHGWLPTCDAAARPHAEDKVRNCG